MHTMLSAPGETVPITRPQSRIRGTARLTAFAVLLVTILGSALPSFAQTYLSSLSAAAPTFVAIDTRASTTWLYVSEHGGTSGTPPTGGGRVLRYNLTSGSTTAQVVASRGTGNGQFISPDAILVDAATGDLFISDRYQNKIQRLSVDQTTGAGTFVMGWGASTGGAVANEMHGPVGLARDSTGAIYVAEHGDINTGSGGNFVSKYTLTGSGAAAVATQVWRKGNSFNVPYGVAVSGSSLLISDGFNARVQIWDLNGNPTGEFALAGTIPLGLYLDSAGALWIAESSDNGSGAIQRVEKRTVAGASLGVSFGTNGSGNGQFSLPFDVVVNAAGTRAYVADYGNNRVQVFDLTAAPAPVISSPTSASATVGTAFSYQITASNSPTSYAATGLSGTGLSVNTATGAITGTPTAAGTITSTISATNASGAGTATLTITVAAAGGAAPVISSATSANATVGTAFSYQITASNSPTSYAANGLSGTGLSVNTSTGAITGTPTAAGTIAATISATNASGTGSATLTITVAGTGGGITSPTLPAGPAISSFVLDTSAGSIVQAPGPLASSARMIVTFDSAVSGVDQTDFQISGPAAITGVTAVSTTQYRVAFNYTNDNPAYLQVAIKTSGTGITDASANAFYGKGVTATSGAPIQNGSTFITPPSVVSFTAGTPSASSVNLTLTFSAAVSGVGAGDFLVAKTGTIAPTVNAPTSADGGVTWTIPVSFTGTGAFELFLAGGSTTNVQTTGSPVMWYDSSGTSTSAVVSVGGTSGTPPAISSAMSASATVNAAFSYQITATNSPTSFAATGLTGTGLSVNSAGLISGTPTAAGTITSTISATNASGTGFAGLTITVAAAGGSAPTITSPTTASATAGTAFSYQITASGSPTSFAASGLTGTGLSVNSAGLISGTPSAAGTITSTISATNANGTGSATLTITVGAAGAAPTVTSPTTASATAGTAFSYQITASGSPTSFAASGLTGTGLSVNSAGLISGTPSAAGTITSTISATNANGTGSATLTISVAAAGTPPTIAAQTVSGNQNVALSYQVVATGATSFSVVGTPALPAGLSLSSSGVISGTPTSGGSTAVTVRATNSFGGNQATVTINITADTTAPTVSSFTLGTNTASSVNFTLNFSESVTGVSPDDFTVTTSSSATTATVASVTPASGASYTVTASYSGPAGGTVRLTVKSSGTGIADLAGNAYAGGGTPNSAVFTLPSGPVVTSTTVAGLTGSAFSYQIQATLNPTSYSSGTLPAGLALNTSTGLIAGTPSTVGTSTVTISATNANGTGSGTLTFQISQGNSSGGSGGGGGVTPPVSGGGGGGGGTFTTTIVFAPVTGAAVNQPITLNATANTGQTVAFSLVSGNATLTGNVLTPKAAGAIVVRATVPGSSASADQTITVKNGQTIAFNSPTSNIQINEPIQLSATSSAGLPVTFSVVSGNATLSGNTLTPKGPGAIVVRASSAGSDSVAAASIDVNFGNPLKATQHLNIAGVSDTTVTAGPMTLIATSDSGLPVTLTVSGPARLSGNLLTLMGAPGMVTVSAAQNGNDTFAAAQASRSFAVRAIGQQVFLGTMGSDTFAIVVSQDNSKGVFVTRLAATGEAIVGKFSLNSDGTFRVNATSSTPASSGDVSPAAGRPVAALVAPRTISGSISNGVATGSIEELDTTFSANIAPQTGSTASLSGVYVASIPGSASGATYIVAGPNGTAYAVAVTPLGVTSGTGTITADGAIDISTAGGGSIVGTVDASTGLLNGTLRSGNNTAALVGLSQAAERNDRLVNLSSRLRVTTGDASRSVIAGFVVAGTESKEVLVRAVGPGLAGFGVTDALANPRLQLFSGAGALVAENDDWNNNSDLDDVANRVGAFKLAASSRDSAIHANLAPGAYTAVVSGVNGNGVALVEVYDASTNTAISASQQLVNLSTRGFVDTGEGNLIAGFVVAGNAPKRVLIRGIGPSLTQFGVPGAVADPMLTIYAAGSATPIAQNNDWTVPQPMGVTQFAATAAEINEAATATGAFPLTANSKDAAIVITLMPGQYSAVVTGANNSTGAGLVEVYELSNQ